MKKTARQECDHCGGQDPASSCGRCGAAKYCSKECQRAHWKGGHNLVCVSSEKRQPAPLPKREGDECAICLHPFETNTICTLMCDHSFHIDCLKKMISKGGITCPLCRAALPPSEIKYAPNVDVRLCRLAIQLNPSEITFLTCIRNTPEEKRKSLLLEAINYFPEYPLFRNILAFLLIEQEDDFASAVHQFQIIVSLFERHSFHSDQTILKLSDTYYNLALALLDLGNSSQAFIEINRLIRCRPYLKGNFTMSDVYNVLGCVLVHMNDARAQKEFKRAIQMCPTDLLARKNWAQWLKPHEPHRASQMCSKWGIVPDDRFRGVYVFFHY